LAVATGGRCVFAVGVGAAVAVGRALARTETVAAGVEVGSVVAGSTTTVGAADAELATSKEAPGREAEWALTDGAFVTAEAEAWCSPLG